MTRTFYYEGLSVSWANIKREVEKRFPGYVLEDYDYQIIGEVRGTEMQEHYNFYCGHEYKITVKLSEETSFFDNDDYWRAFFQGR